MKKEEKGFTLVELLAVLVILAVIAVIASPMVIGTINNSKKSLSKEQKNRIIEAGKLYFSKNDAGNCSCVSVQQLSTAGFIDAKDVRDPNGGGTLNGVVMAKWLNQTGNEPTEATPDRYEYSYEGKCPTDCKYE